MKYVFLLLLSATIINTAHSQVSNSNAGGKYPLVRVRDWGQNTLIFGSEDDYWDPVADEVIKQIGKEKFEKVKANSGYRNIPSQMSIWDGRTKRDANGLYAKLNQLKLYKIATFTDIGTARKTIAILQCPYEENKSWDSTVKWNTVYFVIAEDALEQ